MDNMNTLYGSLVANYVIIHTNIFELTWMKIGTALFFARGQSLISLKEAVF